MTLPTISPTGFIKMRAKLVLYDKFVDAIIDGI
jgi:hypothetical protein